MDMQNREHSMQNEYTFGWSFIQELDLFMILIKSYYFLTYKKYFYSYRAIGNGKFFKEHVTIDAFWSIFLKKF